MRLPPLFRLHRKNVVIIGALFLFVLCFMDASLLSWSAANMYLDHRLHSCNSAYTIPNEVCRAYNDTLLAVILVVSLPNHEALRAAHREALPQEVLADLGMQRIFLLGGPQYAYRAQKKYMMLHLLKEQSKHKDLLMGKFKDKAYDLVRKHIMGLQWATKCCAKAPYIIKVEEDIVYDVYIVKRFLHLYANLIEEPHWMAGYAEQKLVSVPPATKRLYGIDVLQPKLPIKQHLRGWFYITNQNTAVQLLRVSFDAKPRFAFDDLWVTGEMRERANISVIELNWWFTEDSDILRCCLADLERRRPLECERYVGPSDGDVKLLIAFQQQMRRCYSGFCYQRTEKTALRNTCNSSVVGKLDRHFAGFGKIF